MSAWWQDAVVYQIYPRSFQDSSGNGTGDLDGIRHRLDYLCELGVNTLWLSPIFPSPMHDFGYDVRDYRGVDALFGDLDALRDLVDAAHERGLRVLLDLVLNHTSNEHDWFREARRSRDNEKRDWYIWHDGHRRLGVRRPPNNWQSAFGGSAWNFDRVTGQYYLHTFLASQPDVNWRNPDLAAAMKDVIRYWLDFGVDGFRFDVVNWFLKDEALRDNPWARLGRRPYDMQRHVHDRDHPDTPALLGELREVLDAYDAFGVGEVFVEAPGDARLPAAHVCTPKSAHGLHAAFNFEPLYLPFDARAIAAAILRWETALGGARWPTWTFSNHDQPRYASRFATDAPAKVMAALLLTLRGTPFLYYGEELGMRDVPVPRDRMRDPVGIRYWPFHKGRDPCRTPMQWENAPGAGFTTGTPWLPLGESRRNVAMQSADPESLYSFYRALLTLRAGETDLRSAPYRQLYASDEALVFSRGALQIGVNFSGRVARIENLDGEVLLSTHGHVSAPGALPPHGVVITRAAR